MPASDTPQKNGSAGARATRLRRLAVAAIVVAATQAGSVARAQPESRTLQHQGVARSYIIANAAAALAGPRPLMLVLHGRRGADEPHRSSPALDALAAKEGFVAVYPAGFGGVWNAPTRTGNAEVPLAMAGKDPADDYGFLLRLMDRLVAQRVVDAKRIYVSGASMGGMMTYALMCGASRKIAAAAPLIANMTERQLATCKPARAVPVVLIAGLADQVMPYYGRDAEGGRRLTSMPETLRFWQRVHRCTGSTDKFLSTPIQALEAGGVSTVKIDYTGCRVEGSMRFFRVDGGGHTLPSRQPISDDQRRRFGPRSTEIETSEEVWAFFKQFTLPARRQSSTYRTSR